MLILVTEDFQLRMAPVSAQFEEPGGPYLEWIDVQINVSTPGIQAEGRWSVMPAELAQFHQQLEAMRTHLGFGQEAELSGVEPGFRMRLQMLKLGAIAGDWRFQPIPPDGAHASGQFACDQSYLDELMRGAEGLRSFRHVEPR